MRAIKPRLSGSGRPRQGIRPSARAGEQARAFDQRRPAGGVELAEHVGPGAIAADGGAGAAVAIGKTLDRPHHDAAAGGRLGGRLGQDRARTRLALRLAGAPAGDADIDDRGIGRCLGVGHVALLDDGHPCRSKGGMSPSRVPERNRPAPRHPARPATESTAGLLARGSPPVTAFPDVPVAVWYGLAAYSCGGSCGIGTCVPHRIPCSLSRERPSMGPLNGGRRGFVNADVTVMFWGVSS